MENKKDRNKMKEPYTPEGTPNPPQIIDPSYEEERKDKPASTHDKPQPEHERQPAADDKKDKKKNLR